MKAPDGTTIPFVSVDDIKQKEKRRKEMLQQRNQTIISAGNAVDGENKEDGAEVDGTTPAEPANAEDPGREENKNASVAEAIAVS